MFRSIGISLLNTDVIQYKIYTFFLRFTFSFLYSVSVAIKLILLTDVDEAAHCMYMRLVIEMCVGLVNFLTFNKQTLHFFATNNEFRLKNLSERIMLHGQRKKHLNLVIWSLVMCSATIETSCIMVFFQTQTKLPFPSWFPLDYQDNSTGYWIACGHQYMTRLTMKMLSVRQQNFGNHYNENLLNVTSSHRNADMLLLDYIEVYQIFLSLKEEIQNCFTFTFFLDICTMAMSICGLASQIAELSPSKDYATCGFYVSYTLIAVSQIFYFGNEILTLTLNSSNWSAMLVQYKKCLMIFMERSTTESTLIVGNMFTLSCTTFTSIMSFLHKLLAILQSFLKKDEKDVNEI